jgi:hypothetical protein
MIVIAARNRGLESCRNNAQNTPLGGMNNAARFPSGFFPSSHRDPFGARGEANTSPLERRQADERTAKQAEVYWLLCNDLPEAGYRLITRCSVPETHPSAELRANDETSED